MRILKTSIAQVIDVNWIRNGTNIVLRRISIEYNVDNDYLMLEKVKTIMSSLFSW